MKEKSQFCEENTNLKNDIKERKKLSTDTTIKLQEILVLAFITTNVFQRYIGPILLHISEIRKLKNILDLYFK